MKVLIVNNISREGPGLLKEILEENRIDYYIYDFEREKLFPSPDDYDAIFVFGGPDSANDETEKMKEEIKGVKEFLNKEVPYFGICLGLQVMVKALGGKVMKNPIKEVGWRDPQDNIFKVHLTEDGKKDPIFEGVESEFDIFQLHGETVELTSEMKLLGTGEYCKNQIVRYGKNAYGFQGHIELSSDMFYTWIREDEDLNKLDKYKLEKDYNKVRKTYESSGRKILKNFLDVSSF
ncbi:MAG: GMP synthase (glutamine-hydrolyzing) subunit A [Candidatus Methanofastidiosum methylothiophilum]|uniref:GMP synthase (Glutamine-hydrolyzing) subunit A n=1 Tax=Candidatus Methanofastidiosum methylothiophilum TaxID=1705564 RepID=A0A150IT68_9EURY|nr:MAG: GMP synthase (glutamine-hydrolyzing) subunit A [Candidatus Methanofastidiosum methylthiophilus]KYC48122.1 MAG: GMP synthase (glutamine-hydrolyzing) subunit A [Candidatus Methanofastidiosum methylthiophilus]KYC50639.1 MAG: GMP synthase (glutamine-hydrolyzing) subunit A [Candidatus Methanofastidiosum methylthiophilus]